MLILKSDKMPFLFVLLFAVLGWLITHIVDRLTSAPFLAYSVEKTVCRGNYKLTYTINNISYDKNVTEIDFLIIPEPYQEIKILKGAYRLLPPMKKGESDLADPTLSYYKYHLSNLQPHCTFIIELLTDKNETIPLRIFSKSTVLLEETGISTFIVRYEMHIYVALIIMIVVLVVWYSIKYK